MTKYIKKIYLNKELETYFILASKTKDAGHHVIDLDKNFKYIKLRIVHKKIKLATMYGTNCHALRRSKMIYHFGMLFVLKFGA